MSLHRIQGRIEKAKGIYYEFNPDDPPLGEGGMGKVYKGKCVNERTHASHDVAIKFMYSDLPPYAIEKARREAAIQFRHDNLIEMLGFIETESKSVLGETIHHYHVVSELLVGVSLDSMFEGKLTDQQGNLVPYAEKLSRDYKQDPNHFAITITKNILSGLMMMHDAGYIHRDIDPTNIMITTDGHIKLIDFGIAKKMNNLTTHDKHLTQAGQFVGKPEYAAPELVLGAINEQNQTTDIYAVGILLFQCIVGHVPFEGDRSEILQKQVHSPLPLRLIKHKGLRKIIETATNKSRAKRFQSSAEFRVALDRIDLNPNPIEIPVGLKYALCGAAACLLIGGGVIGIAHSGLLDKKETSSTLSYSGGGGGSSSSGGGSTIGTGISSSTSGSTKTVARTSSAVHNDDITLEYLERKSLAGDSKATYLWSRLLFKSRLKGDYCPDSITRLQKKLGVKCDNIEAHNLLKKAVRQDSKNYYAMYELACDYWKADQRTEAVPNRKGEEAKELFEKSLSYAYTDNNTLYINMIQKYLKDVGKWEENLRKINMKK